ncbi:MAG TPA: HAD hydrolase family protein [Microbacteriaceae bacterium]|nr:HAD hydrolase family protein [Microbacteriaceae bacterium]
MSPLSHTERWLVALDVDGTILHEDETLSPVVVDAIARVRDAGHAVTLATGRAWQHSKTILDALALEPEYVVCANGAVIMRRDSEAPDGYRREHVETFRPMPVLQRIRDVLPDGRFMIEDPVGRRFYTEGMFEWNLDGAEMVEFDELGEIIATRVVCVSPGHTSDDFLKIVEQAGLHQVSYSIGWTAWLDIAPEGVDKGTAAERMREWLGIPLDRVFVAGDGRNDIEMFRWAAQQGRAVALGQAPDEVKQAATEVTAHVEADGLALALLSLPGLS